MPSTIQKLLRLADVRGDLPAFLKQLMRGFVKDRAGILVLAGKEVGRALRVQVQAQRDVDLRLQAAQPVAVLVAIAEVDHVVLLGRAARRLPAKSAS